MRFSGARIDDDVGREDLNWTEEEASASGSVEEDGENHQAETEGGDCQACPERGEADGTSPEDSQGE